jgi:hypothetical protein
MSHWYVEKEADLEYPFYVIETYGEEKGPYVPLTICSYISLMMWFWREREKLDLVFAEKYIPEDADYRAVVKILFGEKR